MVFWEQCGEWRDWYVFPFCVFGFFSFPLLFHPCHSWPYIRVVLPHLHLTPPLSPEAKTPSSCHFQCHSLSPNAVLWTTKSSPVLSISAFSIELSFFSYDFICVLSKSSLFIYFFQLILLSLSRSPSQHPQGYRAGIGTAIGIFFLLFTGNLKITTFSVS